jgi:hypothetical protein
LKSNDILPRAVKRYLDSDAGQAARTAYKCQNRRPWYVVPDVVVPDAFLSYMCGAEPALVANAAKCVCTNSVHAVRVTGNVSLHEIQSAWSHPLAQLSTEIEGHPLGGGMLKLEPGEAKRIALPRPQLALPSKQVSLLRDGTEAMRRWRHYE